MRGLEQGLKALALTAAFVAGGEAINVAQAPAKPEAIYYYVNVPNDGANVEIDGVADVYPKDVEYKGYENTAKGKVKWIYWERVQCTTGSNGYEQSGSYGSSKGEQKIALAIGDMTCANGRLTAEMDAAIPNTFGIIGPS